MFFNSFKQFSKQFFNSYKNINLNRQAQIFGVSSLAFLGNYFIQNNIIQNQDHHHAYRSKEYFDRKFNWHFRKMSNHNFSNVVVIAGNSNKQLSQEIASFLNIELTPVKISKFQDGELDFKVDDPDVIRGKHVYFIQSTCTPVNENLMTIALISGWLRKHHAKSVTVVMPYYGYSRFNHKRNLSIEASKILGSMAIDRFMTIDIHSGQILGYFPPKIQFENLNPLIVPLNYFLNIYDEKREDFVIISPDANGVSKAKQFCELFNQKGGSNCQLGILLKQGNTDERILIGDVQGKNIIIIDDLIDTGSTLTKSIEYLKKNGAKKIYAYATHSLFSGSAFDNIRNSQVDQIITTDTIPQQPQEDSHKNIIRLGIAPLFAEAIRRLHHNLCLENLSGEFYDINHQKMSDKTVST